MTKRPTTPFGHVRYVPVYDDRQAGAWGLSGGVAAGLIGLAASIVAAGMVFPWKKTGGEIWPYLVVFAIGLIVGGLVAAAAHSQMTGEWPALLLGAAAPSVIRGILSRVEVTPQAAVALGNADATR